MFNFLFNFAIEILGCSLSFGLSLIESYRSLTASRTSRVIHETLLLQASRAQCLLETAMPPHVARQLLAGTPAHELSRSYDGVTIAFISLDDFREKESAGDPMALIEWLNDVYQAIDGLVDAYCERITKIEVGNTCSSLHLVVISPI